MTGHSLTLLTSVRSQISDLRSRISDLGSQISDLRSHTFLQWISPPFPSRAAYYESNFNLHNFFYNDQCRVHLLRRLFVKLVYQALIILKKGVQIKIGFVVVEHKAARDSPAYML